jgi:hypothetical protein
MMADADPRAIKRWTRRPLFSPSQTLTAEQLNLMMDDQRSRTQKAMRALHGNGVIFGLAATQEEGRPPLKVSCGMALDRHGRLLHWAGGAIDGDLVKMPDCADRFTLSIHYARREVPGAGCGPCSDRPQWIEEGVVFSLREGCGPFDRACPQASKPDCISLDDYVCFRTASEEGALRPAPDLKYACADAEPLTRRGCSDIFYDPDAGIPIACVDVVNLCANTHCDPQWAFGGVSDACDVRPYVYRTPLLYELIKGCQNDLARVQSVRWGANPGTTDSWPDELDWNSFAQAVRAGPEIAFTRPVRIASVHPGSLFLTAIIWERQADYMLARRIPAVPEPLDGEDGLATRFRFRVNVGWIRNEIDSRSELRSGGRIELTARGQMIRDRCGNMLDALPLDYHPGSPPQSRPGGDFVAMLRFAAERGMPVEDEDEAAEPGSPGAGEDKAAETGQANQE